MVINRKGFLRILNDNTETYFKHLEGIICSIDVHASLELTKRIEGINVRISPSEPKFLFLLRKDIEQQHNILGLRMEYSKSMNSSGVINYNLDGIV